jgi:hypothetical protein
MAHQHRQSRAKANLKAAEGVWPFNGQVAWPGNPRAHGGVSTVEICHCGARRIINLNNGQSENGEWK